MLAAVLARHAGPRGILFDRPHVVKDAPALLDAKGVSDRVTIQPAISSKVSPRADAYILSHIIHDWDEDQCLTILGHVRKAMKPAGRLLIVEMVLPSGDTPHREKYSISRCLYKRGAGTNGIRIRVTFGQGRFPPNAGRADQFSGEYRGSRGGMSESGCWLGVRFGSFATERFPAERPQSPLWPETDQCFMLSPL